MKFNAGTVGLAQNIKNRMKNICLFSHSIFIVSTGSMIGSKNDSLNIGDIIFIKKNNHKTKYKNGEIISFYKNNNVVTHRIIEEKNDKYVTKGDNNKKKDSKLVESSNIIGKCIGKTKTKNIDQIINKRNLFIIVFLEFLLLVFLIKHYIFGKEGFVNENR